MKGLVLSNVQELLEIVKVIETALKSRIVLSMLLWETNSSVPVLRASAANMDLWIWRKCDVVMIVYHPSSWPRVTSTMSCRFF
jgi:hypothetical protein